MMFEVQRRQRGANKKPEAQFDPRATFREILAAAIDALDHHDRAELLHPTGNELPLGRGFVD